MRILALDIGDVRIGVAISDSLGITANGVETYKCKSPEADIQYFADMARLKACDGIVIGLPINMDGTEGDRALKVRIIGDNLAAATGLPIYYEDERLTTVEAEQVLIEAGMRREKRKEVIDKVAAVIILRSYLNKN